MDVNNTLFEAVRCGNINVATEIINTYGLSHSEKWDMGYVLLFISTRKNHTEMTKLLLTSCAKVNSDNSSKRVASSPLLIAATNGNKEIVEMLLDREANIYAKNQYGYTALEIAVFRGHSDIIELLLERGAPANEHKINELTCLQTAVEKSNFIDICVLLKYGANINAVTNRRGREGQTAMHIAAEKGDEEIVKLLLKNDAFINIKSKSGHAPVYIALLFQHDNVVKTLLYYGAHIDTQYLTNKTILQLAVEQRSLEMIDHILLYGPDTENKLNINALKIAINGDKLKYKLIVKKLLDYGFTYPFSDLSLLQIAIEKGYTQFVENCLRSWSNVNLLLRNVQKKFFLLHTAVKMSEYDIIEILIKYGANVNDRDRKRKTPIYYATQCGDLKSVNILLANKATIRNCRSLLINAVIKDSIDIVNLLLTHKVNLNEVDISGKTALHFSGLNQYVVSFLCREQAEDNIEISQEQVTAKALIAKILLNAGSKVNAISRDGKSTLHLACSNGYYEVVKVLFDYDAKMFPDNFGALPIHMGGTSGNVDILKMLIAKGADINAKTKRGWTAVHFAADNGRIEYLEHLLKHGADINAQEETGSTALHIAARKNQTDFVKLLLRYGADVDCTNYRGKTALNIAVVERYDRVVNTLLQFGCDIRSMSQRNSELLETSMLWSIHISDDYFDDFSPDDEFDDDDEFYDTDFFDDYSDFNESDSDYYDRNYFNHGGNIAKMLKYHVIMMKMANLPLIGKEISKSYDTSISLLNFQINCEHEVARLKSEKIDANTNVTYYDVLSKPIDKVVLYGRNQQIVDAVKRINVKAKFPIYSGFINAKIARAIVRKDLLEDGNEFFNRISIQLPYNCTERILRYFTDRDLRILFVASNSNK